MPIAGYYGKRRLGFRRSRIGVLDKEGKDLI